MLFDFKYYMISTIYSTIGLNTPSQIWTCLASADSRVHCSILEVQSLWQALIRRKSAIILLYLFFTSISYFLIRLDFIFIKDPLYHIVLIIYCCIAVFLLILYFIASSSTNKSVLIKIGLFFVLVLLFWILFINL